MHFDTLWIFVLGKPDFRSIYYNFQTNCWIILLFFSGEADSLCEHFEPSHTVFNDSQFMLWRHQTSSHPPRRNFATGAEVTNPKNADICKRRRVKGLENYFNRKGNQFYIIWYILNHHYVKVIINILYFTAPAELNQNIKYCKSQ